MINIKVTSDISTSIRARQVSAMFDVPIQEKCSLSWNGDFPYDEQPWNIGLIVGPSGSGKSTIAKHVFGEEARFEWIAKSVIDDFASHLSVQEITDACSSVGFNTIPAWMRPYAVLSNGEKFRVDLARRLLECQDLVLIDEFTSVVDRQVAKIGSHAVQKYVRKSNRKFVAVSCHYDIAEWLRPDWVLDVSTMSFTRRLLQQRPKLECQVARAPYTSWRTFAPYHYMSNDLNPAARCYALWVGEQIAAFAGVLHMPHPKVKDIKSVSRLVTLPDFQGMGLAMALVDEVGSAHRANGLRLRTYPAHPALIKSFDRSKNWRLEKKPGFSQKSFTPSQGQKGGRPCAVFEYCGPAMPKSEAIALMG